MEQLALGVGNVREPVSRAAGVLRAGGVILYPTDTLYGLGADAFSDEAVANVYAIKGRDWEKPIHCIVADIEMAERYGEMNLFARKLAEEFLPGPLTLVLKKKEGIQGGIAHGATIGIRIPDNDFCIALAREYGAPYTTTSANRAGEEPLATVPGILGQLGHSHTLKSVRVIDLVIDAGELPARAPSTVVDVSGEEPIILREGAIPAADIWETIRSEY